MMTEPITKVGLVCSVIKSVDVGENSKTESRTKKFEQKWEESVDFWIAGATEEVRGCPLPPNVGTVRACLHPFSTRIAVSETTCTAFSGDCLQRVVFKFVSDHSIHLSQSVSWCCCDCVLILTVLLVEKVRSEWRIPSMCLTEVRMDRHVELIPR